MINGLRLFHFQTHGRNTLLFLGRWRVLHDNHRGADLRIKTFMLDADNEAENFQKEDRLISNDRPLL